MIRATYRKYQFHFINPGVTSRGVMEERISWFVIVHDTNNPAIMGIGECAPLPGLSRDDMNGIERKLDWVCSHIHTEEILQPTNFSDYPSILFGIETALHDLTNGGTRLIFKNSFYSQSRGIPINGLIWMGTIENMFKAVQSKINNGFTCIKIKISSGGIEQELNLIREVRRLYGPDLEIRVDANGAFDYDSCMPVLEKLAALKIHSIEQPIPSNAYESMAEICKISPVPVALDEDIIQWPAIRDKIELFEMIHPPFIVLKPGLIGGFTETEQWIKLAEAYHTKWWITSALESSIGLNAIAQFSNQWSFSTVQGLGTGQIYSNNIPSPLFVSNGYLYYNSQADWDLKILTE